MKLRRQVLIFCLVFAFFMMARLDAATAGGKEFEPIDAQALVDACWAKTAHTRGPGSTTGSMREGGAITIGCLEEVILDQAEILFEPEYFSRRQVEEKLDQLADAYQKLYWSIYNQHRGCVPCGTMYHVFHLGAHSAILKKMIKDMRPTAKVVF